MCVLQAKMWLACCTLCHSGIWGAGHRPPGSMICEETAMAMLSLQPSGVQAQTIHRFPGRLQLGVLRPCTLKHAATNIVMQLQVTHQTQYLQAANHIAVPAARAHQRAGGLQ